MINLRTYKQSDYAQVILLQKEPLIAINAWKGEGAWDADLETIENMYDGRRGELLVYEFKGKIVAMGAYYFITDLIAEIRRMRVATAFQGRGLASKIYTELELRTRSRGAQKLVLDTGEQQMAARQLYKKLGFVETEHKVIWGMKCIVMEKLLQ